MLRHVCLLVVVALALLAAVPTSAQSVSSAISYQGKLTNAAGSPVPDGSYSLTFKFYTVSVGGVPVWTSPAIAVTTSGGIFTAPIDSVPDSAIPGADVYIETMVGAETLSPRTKLASAPFALRAGDLSLPFAKTGSSTIPAFQISDSTADSVAVEGESDTGANSKGVYGVSANGFGVYAASANNIGMYASGGMGGVQGNSTNGTGVAGSGAIGVKGFSSLANSVGVFGEVDTGASARGVLGTSTNGVGVYGSSTNSYGVQGFSAANFAVYGNGLLGVEGHSSGFDGTGVAGDCNTGPDAWGVYGASTTGFAGYFSGNVKVIGNLTVTGSVSKGSGSFKIDHPLDPANKYLVHSFVESPEMKNVYDGVVKLDSNGEATVFRTTSRRSTPTSDTN